MILEYSVIIRTTGKAGEKYKKLLSSIMELEPKPKDVIVVLPEGNSIPSDGIGIEKFYFCKKGMVMQRLFGVEACKTQYALITDDDISFDTDFVKKLSEPVVSGKYALSAGPLLSFFPQGFFQRTVAAFCGSAVPSIFHLKRYNTVLKTTGYSYSTKIKIRSNQLYETQSAPWTCFFADIYKLKKIHFEEEMWLDKNGYAEHDDTAMFYKSWLNGNKTVIVADAIYEHLDAKTSTKGNRGLVRYSSGFNTIVFWHRFLFKESVGIERIWCVICLVYTYYMRKLLDLIAVKRGKMTEQECKAYQNGVNAGRQWLKTDEYKSMRSVIVIDENNIDKNCESI